jgi:hypothetical protein
LWSQVKNKILFCYWGFILKFLYKSFIYP